MNEKIGKVTLNLDYYEGQDFYSDGVIEEHLLELVKHHEPEEYQDIILKEKNWAVMYHLSQQRENILEWYPITKEDSVLEIGAGCGAISGVLAKKAGRVVANDLSKMRSSINAWKNKEAENLEIVVGNFNTVSDNLTETFDYVTLIGVFEYAKTYIQEEEPYRVFLDKINRHLKPNGKILMAIENKLGLKYFAGCKEDHVGRMFEGIEGYKNTSGVETFSKRELEKLQMAITIIGSIILIRIINLQQPFIQILIFQKKENCGITAEILMQSVCCFLMRDLPLIP